jgi:hypothetical protein
VGSSGGWGRDDFKVESRKSLSGSWSVGQAFELNWVIV